jgi:DNA-binding NtrC family response regulator
LAHTVYATRDRVLVAARTFAPGSWLAGSSPNADLQLGQGAPGELCRIDVDRDGHVDVIALGEGDVAGVHGEVDYRQALACGDFVEVAGWRFTLLVDAERLEPTARARPRSAVATTGSPDIKAPTESYALQLCIPQGSSLHDLLGDELFVGRGEGNDIEVWESEVSRRHVRLFRDDHRRWWWEDAGSLLGTWVDGRRLKGGELGPGLVLHLGPGPQAPRLRVLPLEDAYAHTGSDDLTTLLRGRSAPMARLRELIYRYGPLDGPVYLWGPSGSGKQLVAEALHRARAANRPFLVADCGGLSEELLESELFGHVKGAFSGATSNKTGYFEACQGGTLLLDEAGDMTPKLQLRIMHALQEGEIRRVGSTAAIPIHARVILASWKNLAAEVKAGRFREDLFHRVNELEIRVPALREHPEDIPDLARHILAGLQGAQGGKHLTPEALALLVKQAWPGNVRELEKVLSRSAADCTGREIDVPDLRLKTESQLDAEATDSAEAAEHHRHVTDLRAHRHAEDRALVELRLKEHQGNQSAAARSLGLSEAGLRRRLKKWGIS